MAVPSSWTSVVQTLEQFVRFFFLFFHFYWLVSVVICSLYADNTDFSSCLQVCIRSEVSHASMHTIDKFPAHPRMPAYHLLPAWENDWTDAGQFSLYYLQSLSLGVLTQRKWTNRDIKTPPNSVSYLIFFIVLAWFDCELKVWPLWQCIVLEQLWYASQKMVHFWQKKRFGQFLIEFFLAICIRNDHMY